MSPREYELIVASLLKDRFGEKLGSFLLKSPSEIWHLKRFAGASGQSHEIDLSFEIELGGVKFLMLVECKCYRHAVGVDDIAEFAYKLRDIGGHKGIVVTTTGFQSGAITVAKREGIALVKAVKAVKAENAWDVIAHRCEPKTVQYVICDPNTPWMPFGSRCRFPKDVSVSGHLPPKITQRIQPLSNASSFSEVAFLPCIEGFYGDPPGLLQAARIFMLEEDVDSDWLRYAYKSESEPLSDVPPTDSST